MAASSGIVIRLEAEPFGLPLGKEFVLNSPTQMHTRVDYTFSCPLMIYLCVNHQTRYRGGLINVEYVGSVLADALYSISNQEYSPLDEITWFDLSFAGCILPRCGQTGEICLISVPSASKLNLHYYVSRLISHFGITVHEIVSAALCIERLVYYTGVKVRPETVHRILALALITSAKFYRERFYPLDYTASVLGVTRNELNQLEYSFLSGIKFDIFYPSLAAIFDCVFSQLPGTGIVPR